MIYPGHLEVFSVFHGALFGDECGVEVGRMNLQCVGRVHYQVD